MKKNKKKILIICGLVGAIILSVIMIIIFSSPTKKELTNLMTEMGSTFYQDFYKELSESLTENKVKEEVSKLSHIGMSISIDNLAENKANEKMIKKFRKCNSKRTIITIYPEEEFGINDYQTEVTLDC